MNPIEQKDRILSHEQISLSWEEINQNIENLTEKIQQTFPCVENADGSYSLHYNNETFQFTFNQEKMCFEVANKTQQALDYAKENLPPKASFEYHKSLIKEDGITQANTFFPVNLIHASTFEQILGKDPETFLALYAQFLTNVNQKRSEKYENHIHHEKNSTLDTLKDRYFSQINSRLNTKSAQAFQTELSNIAKQKDPLEKKAYQLALIDYMTQNEVTVPYTFTIDSLRILTDEYSDILSNNEKASFVYEWDKLKLLSTSENTFDIQASGRNGTKILWSIHLRNINDKISLWTIQPHTSGKWFVVNTK